MSNEPAEEFFVLPFYLVCDVSSSMSYKSGGEGTSGIDGLNQVLPVLQDEAVKTPMIADVVQLGIISFNDAPHIVRPLSELKREDRLTMAASGGTKFGPVLRELRKTIEQDVDRLKRQNLKVYRPAVFFLSDGGPNDSDWKTAFSELTSPTFKQWPVVIPMGLGGANESVLNDMVHPRDRSKLYMIRNAKDDAAAAIADMAKVMLRTIVSSVASKTEGGELHLFPDQKQLPAGVAVYEYDGGDEV